MKFHKGFLDIAPCVVHLNSPLHGPDSLALCPSPNKNFVVHHLEKKSLESIRVVCKFLDIFLDDLPGHPPGRDVEFKIELQPETSPISRQPYKMAPNELAELKV